MILLPVTLARHSRWVAKPKGHTITGVETQSGKCLDDLPTGLSNHRMPQLFTTHHHRQCLRRAKLHNLR
jgi:hypothetical protein